MNDQRSRGSRRWDALNRSWSLAGGYLLRFLSTAHNPIRCTHGAGDMDSELFARLPHLDACYFYVCNDRMRNPCRVD